MNTSEKHLTNALTVYHCPKMTTQALKKLSPQWSIDHLCNATEKELLATGLQPSQVNHLLKPDRSCIDQALAWVQESENHHIITWEDERYPPLLREIYDPPILLFVKGDASLLSQEQLAIVGSRQGTVMGCETAAQFAGFLSQYFVITSGFASGIDASAHEGALRCGKTIAVMGTGLKCIYPKRNKMLADKICEAGALVSEFPLDAMPHRAHFPKRNRIISGMSLGVLVVEAALKSGSLITAMCATEQGREVFAIPGSIHNPLAKGCHHLIRQGAKLIEKADDILEELSALRKFHYQHDLFTERNEAPPSLENECSQKLLACLSHEPMSIDMIIARSGFPVGTVSSTLLELELSGRVISSVAGYQLSSKTCN